MDKTCSIVQDLLPLYEEDMLREETKEFVDGHLAQCAACRAELDALKTDGGVCVPHRAAVFAVQRDRVGDLALAQRARGRRLGSGWAF